MLQRFQDRVGTAGLIVAIVALVLALGGGAYAASGALTGKQKKEVEKIAKSVSKPGPTGSNGSNGAKGDTGGTGPEGKQGAEGKQGPEGKRGLEGLEGSEGSPWTVGNLPAGKTEMGTWSVGLTTAAGLQLVPLSFAVPLSEGSTVSVHYVNSAGDEEEEGEVVAAPAENCFGTEQNPIAPAGMLCVYTQNGLNTLFTARHQEGRSGVILTFEATAGGAHAQGSWAVTAP